MKKILFILAFSNMLTSELILEITQGTEDPYRVAILKFEGDQKVSNDIDKIIRNNLKRSGEFNLFTNEDLLSLPTDETEVIFNDFKILNIDYLVIGKIVKDGISISVVYDIFDINKGKKIILYFYPKDNTPGCTKEACNFKENWDLLQKNNIVVLGISKDNASSHQTFIEKFNLPFILLTDPEPFKVSTDYDSYGLKKFMGKEYMGMMRNTFLIDAEGKIEKIYLKIKAAIMADHIIADLGLS